MPPETEIQLNLTHLLRLLKLQEFQKLDTEGQVSNVEEVRNLLKLKNCPYPSKKQLVNFLQALKDSDIDEEASRRIQIALDEWDIAPF